MKSTSGSTKISHFRFFGVFEQFSAKPHLVARQNRTISTFGWCMSGTCLLGLIFDFKSFFLLFRGTLQKWEIFDNTNCPKNLRRLILFHFFMLNLNMYLLFFYLIRPQNEAGFCASLAFRTARFWQLKFTVHQKSANVVLICGTVVCGAKGQCNKTSCSRRYSNSAWKLVLQWNLSEHTSLEGWLPQKNEHETPLIWGHSGPYI